MYLYILVDYSKSMYFWPQVRTFILQHVLGTYQVHTQMEIMYQVRTWGKKSNQYVLGVKSTYSDRAVQVCTVL